MYIKLKLHDKDKYVYVNSTYIVTIIQEDGKDYTTIYMTTGLTYYVDGSVEDSYNLITSQTVQNKTDKYLS